MTSHQRRLSQKYFRTLTSSPKERAIRLNVGAKSRRAHADLPIDAAEKMANRLKEFCAVCPASRAGGS